MVHTTLMKRIFQFTTEIINYRWSCILSLCGHNDQLKVFNLRLMELDYVITGFKAIFLLMLQGLFVPFARIGSGDPVRVLRLFHKYTGYN